MVERTTVVFETTGEEGDEQFVREYVLPAMERLRERDWCRDVGFLRYGHAPHDDGGEVRVHLRGDVEAIIEHESDRWETLVEDDLACDWKVVGPEDDSDKFGPRGEEMTVRLQFLTSRMSKHVFEEFDADEGLAPVDTYPEEGPVPVGWWSVLHFLADQQALSPDEEIDAYVEGIRNRLWTLGLWYDYDRADERIDDLIESLEEMRGEVDSMTSDGE
ncbi:MULTISPECIES: hypothetical protein [Halorussus]|uniref:hypothetical protein n=1 Tax=Halorussus TaxID=1070314 RepID=UPI0020A14C3E|nr:hypothetical protein [Halorussus vallis]USZ75136.1 hypothetical protein NGM07_17090 [Halorussus vallis]